MSSVIVWVTVVLKRTVGDSDCRFDRVEAIFGVQVILSVDGIYVSGNWPNWSIKLSCYVIIAPIAF